MHFLRTGQYVGSKNKVPVPNLSTASRFQVPGSKFVNIFKVFFKNILFFVLLWPQNHVKLWRRSDVGIINAEGSDEMPEQSAENQPPQTHSARDHVPPAVAYVPGIAMWRWSEK